MNRSLLRVSFLAVLLSVAFFSCKKSKNSSGNDGRSYFPLQIGKYVTYKVDSTIWIDSLCKQVNTTYQMRYAIADTFRDNMNRLSYVINVYEMQNKPSAPMNLQSTIEVTSTPSDLEYVQAQLRFIKLIFPITDGGAWSGNNLVATGDSDYTYFNNWNYNYQNYQQSFNNGLANFSNTVSVLEDNDSSATSRTYYKEVYANNVGMVYREMTHWTFKRIDDTTVAKCKSGYSVIMRAIDHN